MYKFSMCSYIELILIYSTLILLHITLSPISFLCFLKYYIYKYYHVLNLILVKMNLLIACLTHIVTKKKQKMHDTYKLQLLCMHYS